MMEKQNVWSSLKWEMPGGWRQDSTDQELYVKAITSLTVVGEKEANTSERNQKNENSLPATFNLLHLFRRLRLCA